MTHLSYYQPTVVLASIPGNKSPNYNGAITRKWLKTMDLLPHLMLGGKNLLDCLNPTSNYLPYWYMVVDAERRAEYRFRPHCTGHNIGRWWNTMLRLEASVGFSIPSVIDQAMLVNTWHLAANPSGIFLEDINSADASNWYIHSYRETMLAYGLLVKYRNDPKARDYGRRAILQMRRASQDLQQWDFSYGSGLTSLIKTPTQPVYTHGRAIEGLLCFYQATGEALALDEAERLATYHTTHTFNANGNLAQECGHHTHSYLNTLRGVLQLATIQQQQDRLQMLYASYKNAVRPMITHSGFITHDIGNKYDGDIASAGDIAHIALLLWDYCNDPTLLDDAERLIRARLLPAQVTAPMPITPLKNTDNDAHRDLPTRFIGAIGGSVGHVKGQSCVTDFTAATLHSLIELWQRSVDLEDHQIRINFHFDRKLPNIQIKAIRQNTEASITVHCSVPNKDLLIRVPTWVPTNTLHLTLNEQSLEAVPENGFVRITAQQAPFIVHMRYSLPADTVTEPWRDRFATQEVVHFKWRGDEIYDVDLPGSYMEPFPT